MLGLHFRRNSLKHLFALLLTIGIGSLCWCFWKRRRAYHQRREAILPRRSPLSRSRRSNSPSSSGFASPTSPVAAAPSRSSSAAPASVAPPPPVTTRLAPLPFRVYRDSSSSPQPHHAKVNSTGSGVVDDEFDDNPIGLDLVIKNSDCPICLSAFENGMLLTVLPTCSHAYHPSCIHQWLQSHKDCPICRAEIPRL